MLEDYIIDDRLRYENHYQKVAQTEIEIGGVAGAALQLVTTYMRYLTVETFGNHIWEYQPWVEPFAQWLLNAAHTEPLRQQFRAPLHQRRWYYAYQRWRQSDKSLVNN